MSLSLSLQTALSALKYSQSALQVTSNNIANANTDGYSRKLVSPISQIIGNKGAGLSISTISRQVDENLVRDLRAQTSEFGRLDVRDAFLQLMQNMFGSLNSNSSLSASIGDFANKIEALATFPEDAGTRQGLIATAMAVAQQLNDMSDSLQTLRADADNKIGDALIKLNADFANIKDLNSRIAKSTALKESTAALEDERDSAVARVAEQLDISTFKRSSGEIVLMTKSGRILVDATAATFTHTKVSGLNATTTYPGAIDGINLDGIDITTEIKGGRISGLVDMRDKTLVNMQSELDTLALQLKNQINAVHNDGVGFPAPNALTGTRTVAGGDAFAGTGIVRIAVVDANGNAIAAPLDLNLAGLADVDAVVAAINASPLAAVVTASIVNGKVRISADNAANGVAINEGTSSVGGSGFSNYFGLNDLFVGDATTSLARNIAVRGDIITNPQYLSRGELSEGVLGVGTTAITAGGNSVVQRLAAVFQTSISFAASGNLPASTLKLGEYATQILVDNAGEAARVKDARAFRQTVLNDVKFRAQSVSGVNIDEEMANLIVLQNSFAAASRIIAVTSELMDILAQLGR